MNFSAIERIALQVFGAVLICAGGAVSATPVWAQTAEDARVKDCMQKASTELSEVVFALLQAGRASGALDSSEQAKIAIATALRKLNMVDSPGR